MKTDSWLVQASPKPILWRLMAPLTIVLFLLIISFTTGISIHHSHHLNEYSRWILKGATDELSRALDEQSRALAAIEAILIQETDLQELLKSKDRQRLMDVYSPVLTKMKTDYALTHFYFMDTHRICLLRVHKPEKYGDRFDRFTTLEAERTGKIASGIEIGPLGTFTLRVVQPVFDGGTLIGYLELGKEIEDIIVGIHLLPSLPKPGHLPVNKGIGMEKPLQKLGSMMPHCGLWPVRSMMYPALKWVT